MLKQDQKLTAKTAVNVTESEFEGEELTSMLLSVLNSMRS